MKLRNKLLFLIIFILIAGMPIFALATPAATGRANKYIVKISRVDLYNGTSYITVFNSTSDALDIASASVAGRVGNFLSGLTVADGVYTQVKVWVSTTFTINGSVYYATDGNTYYPTANVSGISCTATTNALSAADATITISSVDPEEKILTSTPITVTDGTPNKKLRVSFDVNNALGFTAAGPGAGIIYPHPPTVAVTVVDN